MYCVDTSGRGVLIRNLLRRWNISGCSKPSVRLAVDPDQASPAQGLTTVMIVSISKF